MLSSSTHHSAAHSAAPIRQRGLRTQAVRPRSVCLNAAPKRLQLHVGETTLDVPFSVDKAQQLQGAFQQLLQSFADKQKATRPKRWDMMEVHFAGAPQSAEPQRFELFCNPNAYSTAFEAKMLITLESRDGLRVTTEARLSAIKSDVDAFLHDAGQGAAGAPGAAVAQ